MAGDEQHPGLRRITASPFHVLGLAPDCTRAEVEREGQKLLGMLESGLSSAASYDAPAGPRVRTAELVREAMAELRDPVKRAGHELWAALPPDASLGLPDERPRPDPDLGELAPFPGAFALFQWRNP